MGELPPIQIAVPATGDEEWQALREVLTSGWVTQGPKVAAFERAFAARHEVTHALACTSGTTAIHLMLAALGIGPGDEVIVPSFTWIATANAVVYCGGTPILVDVDPETYNIDPAAVAAAVTERTRAVIAVHLFGLCAEMERIAAAAPGIPIVEDAACATGASYHDRAAGSLGIAGAFSFHPRKVITTGEGGMVTTNDDDLAAKMAALRNHGASPHCGDATGSPERSEGSGLRPRNSALKDATGSPPLSGDTIPIPRTELGHVPEGSGLRPRNSALQPHAMPDHNVLGYNYRMTDLQGAVGLVQLGKLDTMIEERAARAAAYGEAFAEIEWLRTPTVPEGCVHSWQSYVCTVDEKSSPLSRNEIMKRLQADGIATRPGTHAVHLQGYYRERFGLREDACPVARDCQRQTMALPLHNRMADADYGRVIEAIERLA